MEGRRVYNVPVDELRAVLQFGFRECLPACLQEEGAAVLMDCGDGLLLEFGLLLHLSNTLVFGCGNFIISIYLKITIVIITCESNFH